jgi:hypothetical protein
VEGPLGVIEAYRMVREHVPHLQLALAGSMALDDPEGWDVYERIRSESESDPLIHVFTNLTGVGNIEVNAVRAVARRARQAEGARPLGNHARAELRPRPAGSD